MEVILRTGNGQEDVDEIVEQKGGHHHEGRGLEETAVGEERR